MSFFSPSGWQCTFCQHRGIGETDWENVQGKPSLAGQHFIFFWSVTMMHYNPHTFYLLATESDPTEAVGFFSLTALYDDWPGPLQEALLGPSRGNGYFCWRNGEWRRYTTKLIPKVLLSHSQKKINTINTFWAVGLSCNFTPFYSGFV